MSDVAIESSTTAAQDPRRGATPLREAPAANGTPRVLHISAWDNVGGSSRSAYRIHTGLRRLGVPSRMLVGWRSLPDDPDIGLVGVNRLWPLDRVADRLTQRLSLQYLWYASSAALPYRRWVRQADIIQLYNLHGGYVSHTVLPALSRRTPVVWRLSDMWPMTGHCAYSFDCARWQTGCGACPILSDYPALRHDRTALLWHIKRRLYRRCRLTLVAPSRWMADLTRQSPLLQRFPVHVIPNGLDTAIFKPLDRAVARSFLGLDQQERLVLFGAHYASERRKGAEVLAQALRQLAAWGTDNLRLLIMGRQADVQDRLSGYPVTTLGAIQDDRLLAVAYAAADVFVLPTRADNLPNTILESMACGIPVVSFAVGGVPEAVRHLDTGYAARPGDAADLAQGLRLLLADAQRRQAMGRRARAVAEADYSSGLQAQRFLALYRDLIAAERIERGRRRR